MPLDGRIEKRVPLAVPVYLVTAEELLFAERAITVNTSVPMALAWRPNGTGGLKSSRGSLRCQMSFDCKRLWSTVSPCRIGIFAWD